MKKLRKINIIRTVANDEVDCDVNGASNVNHDIGIDDIDEVDDDDYDDYDDDDDVRMFVDIPDNVDNDDANEYRDAQYVDNDIDHINNTIVNDSAGIDVISNADNSVPSSIKSQQLSSSKSSRKKVKVHLPPLLSHLY